VVFLAKMLINLQMDRWQDKLVDYSELQIQLSNKFWNLKTIYLVLRWNKISLKMAFLAWAQIKREKSDDKSIK